MRSIRVMALTATLIAVAGSVPAVAQHCYTSYGGTKPNKLYLYFPAASDATYPEFGTGIGVPATSPAHAVSIADLTDYGAISGAATAPAVPDGILHAVA